MTRDDIIKQMGWPSNANSTISDLVDRVEAVVRKAEEAAAIRAREKQMTDRELLELAAKAAGIERDKDGEFCIQPHQDDCRWWDDGFCTCGAIWNPLNDDGDALRLAVKLRMGISLPIHKTIKADVVVFTDSSVNVREEGDDPLAATRRAIVRAAAEIGRNMK